LVEITGLVECTILKRTHATFDHATPDVHPGEFNA